MADLMSMLERLELVARELNAVEDLASMRRKAVDLAAEAFRLDVCSLYTFADENTLALVARYQDSESRERIEMGRGIIGWVASEGRPYITGDVRSDSRYEKVIPDTQSEMACPLMWGERVVGVIDLQSRRLSAFSRDDVALFQSYATHLASVLRSVGEGDELRAEVSRQKERADRYELIRRVGLTFIEGPGLEESMQKVVDMVATALNYSQTAVLLLDEDMEELDLISAYGYGEVSGLRIPLSQGATGYAARHAEPVNIADVRTDPRYVKGMSRGRSELAVPILWQEKVLGVLDVESPEPGAFGDRDVETLMVVASYAAAGVMLANCLGDGKMDGGVSDDDR